MIGVTKRTGTVVPQKGASLKTKEFADELAGLKDYHRDFELALTCRANRMLKENELALQTGKYVLVTDVEKWGNALGAGVRSIVSTIHLAAPNVVGVSVAEAESRLKEIEDEILQQLHLIDDQLNQRASSLSAQNPQPKKKNEIY